MQLNEAVSKRLAELLEQQDMTPYGLYVKSGVPKSTISNILHCAFPSMKLRVIHELCQGLGISVIAFFDSPLFEEENLEP